MLAELSGVSESSIYWWERGTHRPHPFNLEAVAETLRVNVDALKGE
jgi:transcriptional regulator with XRE-family HTH domain